ncbi:MAG: sodium/glutamate symporter [Spirochaetaceae bacterium]|jgi:ESS family glutamate:Na+ symporter|nr:sodium/glutamate symporter [Spirochaetaceae bacterium]
MDSVYVNGVLQLKFDMYQAAALGAIMYYAGVWIRSKIPLLLRLSIPAPAIGGLPVAFIAAILQARGIVQFAFDNTLQQVFMLCFFCTVGMNASYKLVLKGGLMVLAFWGISALVSVAQNCIGIPIATAFKLDPLMGFIGGSVPMIGGLGTAGAFGALFEDEYGLSGALSAGIACATFGMVAGSLIGGPLGEWILKLHKIKTPNQIKKLRLIDTETEQEAVLEEVGEIARKQSPVDVESPEDEEDKVSGPHLMKNLAWVLIAVGFGSAVSFYLKKAGITLPAYLGAMMVAIFIRNIGDKTGVFAIDSKSIGMIGDITLALFITMAINSLQLLQLVNLALPLVIMMLAQIALILFVAYFLVFRLFGKNYDSAVMASGLCGFGLGATPNALVCMQAITGKNGHSEKAFFVVPIVGAFLVDISNASVITIMSGFFR